MQVTVWVYAAALSSDSSAARLRTPRVQTHCGVGPPEVFSQCLVCWGNKPSAGFGLSGWAVKVFHLITKWVWTWTKHWTPLSFHFLVCKVEIVPPTLSSVFKNCPAWYQPVKVQLELLVCFQPSLKGHRLFGLSKYYMWRCQQNAWPRAGAR